MISAEKQKKKKIGKVEANRGFNKMLLDYKCLFLKPYKLVVKDSEFFINKYVYGMLKKHIANASS